MYIFKMTQPQKYKFLIKIVFVLPFLCLSTTTHAQEPPPPAAPIDSETASGDKPSSFMSSVLNLITPVFQPTTLVKSGENETEEDPSAVPATQITTLIPEPQENEASVVLAIEKEEQFSTRATDGQQAEGDNTEQAGVTTLIQDVEREAATLLVNQQEEAPKTMMYMEPEFDPPAILYVEGENERDAQVEAQVKYILSTRLIEEPEGDDLPSKTAICLGEEYVMPAPKCTPISPQKAQEKKKKKKKKKKNR